MNEFEAAARTRKVLVLTDRIVGAWRDLTPGQCADRLEDADESQLARYARAAIGRPASAETWRLVISGLRAIQADRDAHPDPFDGLPS